MGRIKVRARVRELVERDALRMEDLLVRPERRSGTIGSDVGQHEESVMVKGAHGDKGPWARLTRKGQIEPGYDEVHVVEVYLKIVQAGVGQKVSRQEAARDQ